MRTQYHLPGDLITISNNATVVASAINIVTAELSLFHQAPINTVAEVRPLELAQVQAQTLGLQLTPARVVEREVVTAGMVGEASPTLLLVG